MSCKTHIVTLVLQATADDENGPIRSSSAAQAGNGHPALSTRQGTARGGPSHAGADAETVAEAANEFQVAKQIDR